MPYGPTRHPNHQPARMMSCTAAAIAQLGGLVDELVEGRVDVVGELDLGDGLHALGGGADGEADDALLRQRRVEDALRPELGRQIHRGAEDAAEGDVFAEKEHALVGAEGRAEGVVDRLEEVHASRGRVPDVGGEGGGGV